MPADPVAVLAGDLNGDGVPDLIYGTQDGVAPSVSTALHVLLGDGKGGYAPGQDISLPTGVSTRCLLSDMNGDRTLDVVCGSHFTGVISTFFGRGDGSFEAPASLVLPETTDELVPAAAGDVNGDGTPDVEVLVGNGLSLYSLVNDGKGNLSLAQTLGTTIYGLQVTMADLNEDGRPDLLIQAGSLNTVVALGNGDGTFTALPQFSGNSGAVLADMDGDGHLDLVGGGQGILKIFHGNADGTFASSPMSTVDFTDGNPYDGTGAGVYLSPLAVRDLNGDGIQDVVSRGQNGLTVLPGEGALSFGAPRSFPVGLDLSEGPRQGVGQFIDMDGDGHVDFVAPGANGVYITYGRGDGSFVSADVYPSGNAVSAVTLADFDEDGHPDAVTIAGSQLMLSLGRADGSFAGATSPVSVSTGASSAVGFDEVLHGDVNGDGHEDIVAVWPDATGTEGTHVLLGQGDGTFSAPTIVPASAGMDLLLSVLDVNGDGRADLVFSGNDGSLTFLLTQANGGYQATKVAAIPSPGEPQVLRVADVNGDGYPDVIRLIGGSVSVSAGQGDGTFGRPITYTLPRLQGNANQTATDVTVGDFDGDGRLDMAVLLTVYDQGSNLSTNKTQIVTLYGQGSSAGIDSGSFSNGVPGPISTQSYASLVATDLDGDGATDLVAQATFFGGSPYSLGTFAGQTNRSFGAENSFAAGTYLTVPQVADLNGDGRPDLLVGNTKGNAFTVLLSEGPAIPFGSLVARPNPVAQGAAFTITASVQVGAQKGTLIGSVTFGVDGQTIGTATLASGAASIPGPTTLRPGLHVLTAVTSALSTAEGASYLPVRLTGRVIVQAAATVTTLAANPNPAGTGQEVTFSVGVANTSGASSGTAVPTGTVTFTAAGLSLGSVTLTSATSSGSGSLKYIFPTPGNYMVTATYGGDTTHSGSTASVNVVVLAAPDFSLNLSTPVVTVAPGQGGNVVVTLGSLNRFAGTLQITESTLPPGVVGSFDPGQATVAPGSHATSTLHITAGQVPGSVAKKQAKVGPFGMKGNVAVLLACVLPLGLAGRKHRRVRFLMALLGAMLTLGGLQGCTDRGVPLLVPGTYPLTITATDPATGLTHTATLRVVVSSESTATETGPR